MVVEFGAISIFEFQSAPFTFALLPLEDLSPRASNCWMRSQSCTPVEKVSIIRTRFSPYFYMPLYMGERMQMQVCFLGLEFPAFAFIHSPIFPHYPVLAFVWVPASCPCL